MIHANASPRARDIVARARACMSDIAHRSSRAITFATIRQRDVSVRKTEKEEEEEEEKKRWLESDGSSENSRVAVRGAFPVCHVRIAKYRAPLLFSLSIPRAGDISRMKSDELSAWFLSPPRRRWSM